MLQAIHRPEDLLPCSPSAFTSGSITFGLDEVVEKPTVKIKPNNTVVAPDCAVFSTRPEVSANASRTPFDAGETGAGVHGDDDGVRVRLTFKVNFMVHLGTYVNGVYHPKGVCNGRRLFCRSLGGGGCPHLFLYYLPDRDCWAVGMYPGDGTVYAVCGPARDEPLTQPWQVWDGTTWVENPACCVTVGYKSDQQTARWEDQASSFHKVTSVKKANHDVRQKMYAYAERGGARPLLEKGGVLQEHAIIVSTDWAFEAVQSTLLAHEPCRKLAWDVKIIDAGDVDRYNAKDDSPLGVANACREYALAYNSRGKRCAAERSWRYDPIVFTIQGHISPQAEDAISVLAMAISCKESKDAEAVRSEIMRNIAASIP